MSRHTRTLAAALTSALLIAAAPAPTPGPVPSPPTVADHPLARAAAWWSDQQFAADGSVLGRTGSPDVGTTVAATLGMLATGHTPTRLDEAVTYVTANLEGYVTGDLGDLPGQLANVILLTLATDGDPHDVGGHDLVARLQATEQQFPSPDAGRFGARPDVFGQSYSHATAVLALALTPGVEPSPASVAYLLDLQCATGGFPSGYVTVAERLVDDCTGDTNTGGLAAAALALLDEPAAAAAVGQFLSDARNADGGWGYGPQSGTDGNSTGLAGLGLAALGLPEPADAPGTFAALAMLQLECTAGQDAGGIRWQADDTTPDRFATFQAMLAFSASGLVDVIAAADADAVASGDDPDALRPVADPCV